jgi:hypothetical protein
MRVFSGNSLWGAILASLCCGAAMAADLSTVKQWVSQYPSEKILDGKPLWDQPGVQAAMRTQWANGSSRSRKRQRTVRKRR